MLAYFTTFSRHCEEPLRRSNPALPLLLLDCSLALAMTSHRLFEIHDDIDNLLVAWRLS
jgi:hypothetical protein